MLRADDCFGTCARLRAKGIELTKEATDHSYGSTAACATHSVSAFNRLSFGARAPSAPRPPERPTERSPGAWNDLAEPHRDAPQG